MVFFCSTSIQVANPLHVRWLAALLLSLCWGLTTAQEPQAARAPRTDTAPRIVITGFRLLNEWLPVDSLLRLKRIELPSDRNTFSISFAQAGTFQTDPVHYFYKLEGADQDWVKTTKSHLVNYT